MADTWRLTDHAPYCDAAKRRDELVDQCSTLQRRIADLKQQIADMQSNGLSADAMAVLGDSPTAVLNDTSTLQTELTELRAALAAHKQALAHHTRNDVANARKAAQQAVQATVTPAYTAKLQGIAESVNALGSELAALTRMRSNYRAHLEPPPAWCTALELWLNEHVHGD